MSRLAATMIRLPKDSKAEGPDNAPERHHPSLQFEDDHLLALLAKSEFDVDFAFNVALIPRNVHAP